MHIWDNSSFLHVSHTSLQQSISSRQGSKKVQPCMCLWKLLLALSLLLFHWINRWQPGQEWACRGVNRGHKYEDIWKIRAYNAIKLSQKKLLLPYSLQFFKQCRDYLLQSLSVICSQVFLKQCSWCKPSLIIELFHEDF